MDPAAHRRRRMTGLIPGYQSTGRPRHRVTGTQSITTYFRWGQEEGSLLPKTRRRDRRTWLVGALALAGWLTASLTGFATPALARTCGSVSIAGGTVSPGTGTHTHPLHPRA